MQNQSEHNSNQSRKYVISIDFALSALMWAHKAQNLLDLSGIICVSVSVCAC